MTAEGKVTGVTALGGLRHSLFAGMTTRGRNLTPYARPKTVCPHQGYTDNKKGRLDGLPL